MALPRQLPLPLPPPGSTVVSLDVADLLYAALADARVVGRLQEIVRGVVREEAEQEIWLGLEDAAAYCGVSVRTFERRVEEVSDKLSPRRTGPAGRREWTKSQLDGYLATTKK